MFHPSQILFDGGAGPGASALDSVWSTGSELPALLERIFATPPEENVWQWAEKNIVLDVVASPTNPGPYDSTIAPHTRFVQEAFLDPAVHQITIKKNSQGGYTEAVLNCIRFCVAHQPRNVLYVIDSVAEARRIARVRLRPTLERCPATAQTITEADEKGDVTALNLYLRDMFIMLIGGSSIGAAANKVISLGVVDEADKLPRVTGGQKHVVEEMKSRFKTVPDGKLIILSEPNEEQDVTTTEYLRGSQHKRFVPCPHCRLFQEMIQERLIFDHCKLPSGDYDLARVKAETFYRCERANSPECPDGKIYDRHKRDMALASEWRATNPNAEPGHISLESSDLFSLFSPGASFGSIALDIIDTFRNPARRKAVQSSRFGKEKRTRRAEVKRDDLLKLRGTYPRGTMPVPCIYVGMFSDVQEGVRKWVKGGFDRKGDLYIVDWGECLDFDHLIVEADKPVIDSSGKTHTVVGGLIDDGYKTDQVRSFCIRTNFRFLPSKGRGNLQARGALVYESRTVHDGHTFNAYHFNDDKFKEALYIDRIREFEKIKSGRKNMSRLWFPADVDADFIDEHMGEELVPEVTTNGFKKFVWKKTRTNDYGDGTKNLYVLWHVVGPDVLAELETAPPPDPQPQPKAA